MAFSGGVSDSLYFRAKGVFVGVAFVGVGMMIILAVAGDWWEGMQSRKWTAADAVVVVSGEKTATSHGSGGRTYEERGWGYG